MSAVEARLRSIALAALTMATLAMPGTRAAAKNAGRADFSDWHLPLPAGPWLISRGPCGSTAAYTHACGFYENQCSIDLIPRSGSMENAPVLAPQAGQVFFLGMREVTGLTLMLQHGDGRVSAFMHLAKVVVGLDQRVSQGQVVAYAGRTGDSGVPHLHFHVLANAVQRECLVPERLDEIDYQKMAATSRNLAWTDLILPDPPAALPAWLPTLSVSVTGPDVILPARVQLAPGTQINLPIAIANDLHKESSVWHAASQLMPTGPASHYTLFEVPLSAPRIAGEYRSAIELRIGSARVVDRVVLLRYSVRQPPETSAGQGRLLGNPTFVSPASWSYVGQPARLCWTALATTGRAPLRFRVMIVGPTPADSGWTTDECWEPPPLAAGTYFWKVFVRDARGYMNQTTQRPYALRIR